MSGPQHYRVAEAIINDTQWNDEHAAVKMAEAQVHATLAHVAVTAELASHSPSPAHVGGSEWEALLHPERSWPGDVTEPPL